MNEPIDSSNAAKQRLLASAREKARCTRLVWAITTGEAILVAAAAVALVRYWLMLPVLVRSGGAALLGALALFGIYRIVRFYRRAARLKRDARDVEAKRYEPNGPTSGAAQSASFERDGLTDGAARPVGRRCPAEPKSV